MKDDNTANSPLKELTSPKGEEIDVGWINIAQNAQKQWTEDNPW